jgi:hypothetical protein
MLANVDVFSPRSVSRASVPLVSLPSFAASGPLLPAVPDLFVPTSATMSSHHGSARLVGSAATVAAGFLLPLCDENGTHSSFSSPVLPLLTNDQSSLHPGHAVGAADATVFSSPVVVVSPVLPLEAAREEIPVAATTLAPLMQGVDVLTERFALLPSLHSSLPHLPFGRNLLWAIGAYQTRETVPQIIRRAPSAQTTNQTMTAAAPHIPGVGPADQASVAHVRDTVLAAVAKSTAIAAAAAAAHPSSMPNVRQ